MTKDPIVLFEHEAACSGCGACMTACPVQAVCMKEGKQGGVYPVIDPAKCIGCGRCRQVCAYQAEKALRRPQKVYAAYGVQEELVKNSASGGAFASLALSFMRSGGMVAGAVMDCDQDGLRVYHVLSDQERDILRMQGSKYVQSEAYACYEDIKKALKAGRRVLFSGTPCQTAAVRQLFGENEGLFTIDLICHGVPPQKMLQEYARILSRHLHGSVQQIIFRDKSVGKSFCARIDVKRGRRLRQRFLRSQDLSFYRYFLEGGIYRENCYACPYAREERTGDITLGDYWSLETVHAEAVASGRIPRKKDWSCMLVNTDKGEQLLQVYGEALQLYPSDIEKAAAYNGQLRHPTEKPGQREDFLKLYAQGGYKAVEADYIRKSGGKMRYALRLLKHLWRNEQLRKGRQA